MQTTFNSLDEIIIANNITEAEGFKCPFCETFHANSEEIQVLASGSVEYRLEDSGYDYKQLLVCPVTNKLYWYLNGV